MTKPSPSSSFSANTNHRYRSTNTNVPCRSFPFPGTRKRNPHCRPCRPVPREFDELFRIQMNVFFDQGNCRSLFLRELLHQLVQPHPEITDKQICLEIELHRHLPFLKEQLKFAEGNSDDDRSELIFKEIFALLSDPSQIADELIKYLDEHFSVAVFARLLMLFNRIFSHSHAFPSMIKPLHRLAELFEEEFCRLVEQIGTSGVDDRTIDLHPRKSVNRFWKLFGNI